MFITFEGIDGSGKSTQIELVEAWLRREGYDVLVRREPGGTELGEAIRDILLDPRWHNMHGRAEYLLYSASRAQLVEEVIRPHLQRPRAVMLLDRYYDSSTVYQGAGRELGEAVLRRIHPFVTGDLIPDLTLYLDVDWATSLARRVSGTPDRLEQNAHDFFDRVRAAYHALCVAEPARVIRIDANRSISDVFEDLKREINRRLSVGLAVSSK